MRTKKAYGWSDYVDNNLRKGIWNRFILTLGGIAHSVEHGKRLWSIYRTLLHEKQKGRLSSIDIERMKAETSHETGDFLSRAKLLPTEADLAKPVHMHQRGVAILYNFLQEHPVKSVGNIGARVDIVSAFCAPRFPDVQFYSMDFQDDLERQNSGLPQSPNWHFRPGYALDHYESGRVQTDVVFMTSTSVCFNNAELNAFLDIFAASGVRYIILNEPWWPKPATLNPFKLTMPEDVDPEHPYVTGWIGNYAHNYPAKLQKRGYKILSSKLVPGNPGHYGLQIIAEK